MKKLTINLTLCFILFISYNCKSDSSSDNENNNTLSENPTTLGSDTIKINVTGTTASVAVGLTVINENTKNKVDSFTFKIKPDGEKADSNGSYTKTITGLTSGNTYTIMVLSDANDNSIADTTDVGQTITGITTGSTKTFDSLKTLSTLNASAGTDTSLKGSRPVCMISSFDYSSNDINNMSSIGSLGVIVLIYDTSGNASPNPVYLPPGSYNNIFCVVDNGDKVVNTGDKYQIISGPTVLVDGDDSKTFTIGDWTTL